MSRPRTPISSRRRRAKTPRATNWCRSMPPRPRGRRPAAGPTVAPTAKQERKTKYWHCPMHPQIVREAPGKCPICGMDLVPMPRRRPRPRRPRLPARPRLRRKSARSSTGCRPWTPATSGTSPARPPAAWTWCRFMRTRGQGREPRAPLRFRPPPSSPWGCGPPRWKSAPCPGIP